MLEQLGELVGTALPAPPPAACTRRSTNSLDLAFRHRAHEAVDRPAAEEGIDRRDRLDAQLLGQHLVLVDVDLDQLHRALGLLHDLLDHRLQLLQGPHHGAQKSTITGTVREASSTSLANLVWSLSLMRSAGGGLRRGALQHRFHEVLGTGNFRVGRNVGRRSPSDARGRGRGLPRPGGLLENHAIAIRDPRTPRRGDPNMG